MKIISWNINSIRVRLEHLARICDTFAPDVICLQETKVHNDLFPIEAVKALGLPHLVFNGIKSYNGVAVLSKYPLEPRDVPLLGKADARHLSVYLPDIDLRLDNLYVPAGGDIPDADLNDKFAYKLDFMDALTRYAEMLPDRSILLGDLNIAPGKFDVWSHTQMLKVVSHTPIEIAAFEKLLRSRELTNIVRETLPEPQKLHSWWSYRVKAWQPESRGLLLDHALLTPDLLAHKPSGKILTETRVWQPKPSDHAPIMLEIDLS